MSDYYTRMHPALTEANLNDLAPIFAVSCPANLHAGLAALIPALLDAGELAAKYSGANFALTTHDIGPIVLSGESEPLLVLRRCFEGLGYSVRVSGVIA